MKKSILRHSGSISLAACLLIGLVSRPVFAQPTMSHSVTNISAAGQSDGAINLTVSGSSPFSYNWSNSASTKDLSALPVGIYTVTVTDNNAASSVASYAVGYGAKWTRLTANVQATGDQVGKTVSGLGRWQSGAQSSQILAANTTGWLEFSAGTSVLYAGFLERYGTPSIRDNYAFTIYLTGTSGSIYANGQNEHTFTYAAGDVMRIERDGTSGLATIYQNGNLIHTSTHSELGELSLATTLYGSGATIDEARTSFHETPPAVDASLTGTNPGANSQGAIDLTATGTGTLSYTWSTGATTEDINSLATGTYTVTVSDGSSIQTVRSYYVGYAAGWEQLTNLAEVSGQDLIKNGGNSHDGYSGAQSAAVLLANATGSAAIRCGTDNDTRFGFLKPEGQYSATADYAFLLVIAGGNNATFYSSGVHEIQIAHHPDDLLRIERDGTTGAAKLYRNETLIHTTTATYTGELRIGSLLRGPYTKAEQAQLSFDVVPPAVSAILAGSNPGNPGNGSIDLTVTGNAPFSYAWSNGETTSDLTGLSNGSYAVTVTDNQGTTTTRTYSVGFHADWTSLRRFAELNGTNLVKNHSITGDSYSGAVSKSVLSENTTGWISFYASDGSTKRVGLLRQGKEHSNNSDYLIHVSVVGNNTLNIYTNGAYRKSFIYKDDDRIRMERDGNSGLAKLYLNSVLFYTSTDSYTGSLVAGGVLQGSYATIDQMQVSFDEKAPALSWTVSNLSAAGTDDGEIDLVATDGEAPYTFLWSNGSTAQDQNNLPAGQYAVTVTGNNGLQIIREISVGFDVQWTNVINASLTNNTLTKTTGAYGSNAGAESEQLLSNGSSGWIEFQMGTSEVKGIGFIDLDAASILSGPYTFRVYFVGGNVAMFYEGNTYKGQVFADENDAFRIHRDGGTGVATFYKNGTLIHTSSTTTTGALSMGTSILTGYGSIADVRCGFTGPPPSISVAVTNTSSTGASDGALDVTASGSGPFAFSWSNGETTEDLSGLLSGNYGLTVTDLVGNSIQSSYGVGLLVHWSDLGSATSVDGLLSSTSSTNGWNAGARSSEIAPANTPVWMEYTVDGTSDIRMFGFQESSATSSLTDSESLLFSIYLFSQGIGYVYQGNQAVGESFNYTDGDVLQLKRLYDGSFELYKNGALTQEGSITNTAALKAQAVFYTANASFDGIRASSGDPIQANVQVVHQTTTNLGAFTLNPMGGRPPYQMVWNGNSPVSAAAYAGLQTQYPTQFTKTYAEYLESILVTNYQDLPSGEYGLRIYDQDLDYSDVVIRVQNDLIWYDLANVINTNGVLTKNTTAGWNNAYAVTANVLGPNADGKVSFELGNTTATQAFGFKEYSASIGNGYQDLAHAFVVENQSIKVWSGGVLSDPVGTYNLGDELSIAREGQQILFRNNDLILSTKDLPYASEVFIGGWVPNTVNSDLRKIHTSGKFDSKPVIDPLVTHAECDNKNSGSIVLRGITGVAGDLPVVSPFAATYVWRKDGEVVSVSNTPNLINVEPGIYELWIDLGSGFYTAVYGLEIAYKVRWKDLALTETLINEDNSLAPDPLAEPTGNGQAVSANTLPVLEAGWISFRVDNQPTNYWTEFSFYEIPNEADKVGVEVNDFGSNLGGFTTNFNHIASQSGSSLMNPVADGQRIRIERDGNLDIHYYLDGIPQWTNISNSHTIPLLSEYGILGKVNLQAGPSVIYEALASFGCNHQPPHALLKRKLDGSVYVLEGAYLAFKYDEDYKDSDNLLEYHIYNNDQSQVVLSGSTALLGDVYGDNRYVIDVTKHNQLVNGYYILEVVNEKGERFYTRLLIDIPS